ncbi:HNH endonuclease signature motif containing protein [Mycobacterium sp. IS-3022]|uniref:HNH endonuclease signature motif containing protein n=1 Tax=Mycobacterium sp. IS-3022 TaxID=1772277 RepID=UPI0007417F0B|nr:HNH endonuclease signature motif containing protein [Mycobacterium sp. IS-3022]KUI02703.1 HNH nuclease [Mycobacterium sp. IS-3022]
MFENVGPETAVAAIEASLRQESTLMARRMAAIAALLAHRTAEAEGIDPDPGWSMVTGFARTSAEIGAAMNMAPSVASRLVSQAESLDTRLPKLARLLEQGAVDWTTTQLIITRTELVCDSLIGRIDEAMAERLARWQTWSRRRVKDVVDRLVCEIDPEAAKERRASSERDRYISVSPQIDGTAQLRGRISARAGAAFDRRLSQLAMSVCANDSRTVAQRRADALDALTEGRGLSCDCGKPDCRARGSAEEEGQVHTVINVIASEETLTGESDRPGYLEGFGVIDADLVREIAETATMRPLEPPIVTPEQSVRYQPSAEVNRWVRFRDLTCRFPGCDRQAAICDLDHTTPFNHADPAAGGLTVPWGLADYCREHHRMKTFHGGPDGWRDEQLSDGTIVWTSPTGRTYRTSPGGFDLFPQMRPACAEPTPRKRNHKRERATRIKRLRAQLATQRPINAEQRRRLRERRREIEGRQWRNRSRFLKIVFKGTAPSTSPWCRWIDDPFEPEDLPPDWEPPPPPPPGPDEPPF